MGHVGMSPEYAQLLRTTVFYRSFVAANMYRQRQAAHRGAIKDASEEAVQACAVSSLLLIGMAGQ